MSNGKHSSNVAGSVSSSSDDVFLSNDGEDRPSHSTLSESIVSPSPINPRSSTFTTYQIQPESCKECERRQELLRVKHQRVLHLESEDRKLTEQLRSSVQLTYRYQEENYQLKHQLHRLNAQLRQIDVQPKKEVDHLQRLRHEVYVYRQLMAEKQRQEEAGQGNYYSSSM